MDIQDEEKHIDIQEILKKHSSYDEEIGIIHR